MALLVAPILMVVVIFLGRYMRSGQTRAGEDAAGSEPGLVMRPGRPGAPAGCPMRLVLRALRAIFWALNGVESSACWGASSAATMRLLSGGDAGRERALRRVLRGAADGRLPWR